MYSRRTFFARTGKAGLMTWLLGTDPAFGAFPVGNVGESPVRLIVDADTGNEVDDLYAIAIALIEPRLKVAGITSAQWHTHPNAPNDTVGESQRLNEEILSLMGMEDIPHPEGSNLPMVNTFRPQPSDAAAFIIEQAKATPLGEKLNVVVLGPATNLASAVLMAPEIIPKVTANYLGFWHHPETRTWNKREFNTNNDPNAVNLLINTHDLEFHVMTASTSQHLVFDKAEVDLHLKGKGGIADYLVNRWESYHRYWQQNDKEKKHWTMWDIAIIQAIAYPELANQSKVQSPYDNLDRPIYAYTSIDVEAMKERFWQVFDGFLQK